MGPVPAGGLASSSGSGARSECLLNLRLWVWEALIKNLGSVMPKKCQPGEEEISLG